jgi:hypothetical protein
MSSIGQTINNVVESIVSSKFVGFLVGNSIIVSAIVTILLIVVVSFIFDVSIKGAAAKRFMKIAVYSFLTLNVFLGLHYYSVAKQLEKDKYKNTLSNVFAGTNYIQGGGYSDRDSVRDNTHDDKPRYDTSKYDRNEQKDTPTEPPLKPGKSGLVPIGTLWTGQ